MEIQALHAREAAAPPPVTTHDVPVTPLAGGKVMASGGNELPQAAVPVVTDVHVAAKLIDRYLRDAGRELSFSVDDTTGIVVVAVRDPSSGELIRQMPSEEALRIASNLATHGPRLVDELA